MQAPMSSYEWWSLWYQGIGVGVAVIGLPVVWYQLRRHRTDRADEANRQRTELEADHDRRKKQATIASCTQLNKEWREQRTAIRGVLGRGVVNDPKLATIKANSDLEQHILALLSSMETFAAGANAEVFDVDLISNICGSYLIAVHTDLELYIRDAQHAGQSIYSEFDTLVGTMRQKRLPVPVTPVKKPVP